MWSLDYTPQQTRQTAHPRIEQSIWHLLEVCHFGRVCRWCFVVLTLIGHKTQAGTRMNSWCLNLPHRDSSGSMQSPCLIQKRRQISSTLQPTWACLHQWRVSLHSGSHLNWLPLGVFLLAGYSAPLSFWKSLFCLHVFNLWGSDWTYRLWYSLLHRWIAASTQIGCNLAVFNRRWFPSYCGFITIFTNQSHIDATFLKSMRPQVLRTRLQ